MKPTAVKSEFIQRRAEGQSYTTIARALKISKSTCSAWEAELAAKIALRRQEELNALYQQYGAVKAARIRRLGETLGRIDEALEAADLTQVAPEKLLDFKLKYTAALKDEYTGTAETLLPTEEAASDSNVYYCLINVYNRLSSGEITVKQAQQELSTIQHIKTALGRATTQDLLADAFGHRELEAPQTLETIATLLDEEEAEDE